jgi:hypothetical protein
MTMMDLTDDEVEMIRRMRLSPEARQAEDAERVAAARAFARASATQAERDAMDAFDALTDEQKEAVRLVSQYAAIAEAVAASQDAIASIAETKVIEVPDELLSGAVGGAAAKKIG